MDIKKIIHYWIKSADEDYKTAQALFTSGRYAHALFFCHLTIEKILKALVVDKTKHHAPYEHNLLDLSKLVGLKLSKDQLDELDEINGFNIKGRYDDYKFEFHKKATKAYATKYMMKSGTIHLWLKQQLSN